MCVAIVVGERVKGRPGRSANPISLDVYSWYEEEQLRLIIGTNYIMSDVALSMSLEVSWVEKGNVKGNVSLWLLRPDRGY